MRRNSNSSRVAAEAPSTTAGSKAPTAAPAPPSAAPPLKTEPEGPEAEGKARAQAIFEQAGRCLHGRAYFEAVELLLVTNRIYPDPKLCFNVARAYEGLGNSAGALRYYREYLRRTPSAAPTGPMSRPAFTAAFLEGAGVGEKAAGGVLPG